MTKVSLLLLFIFINLMNFINLSPFRPAVYTAQIMIENYPTPFRTRSLQYDNKDMSLQAVFSNPYPNPANDFITITCDNLNNQSEYICKVYYITGKLINSYQVDNNTIYIDTRHYAYGMYLLNIVENNTIIHSNKFLIIK